MPGASIQQVFQVALVHHQAGRLEEAEPLYRQVIAGHPRHADALHLLGFLLYQSGRGARGIELIHEAIALFPLVPDFHNNLGTALKSQHRLEEAIAAFHEALRLNPQFAPAHNNLGNALRDQGCLEEAIVEFRQAIALQADFAVALSNLGNTLGDLGRFEEAHSAFSQAITLEPDLAEARFGQALLWLLCGDYERGWPGYEARWAAHRIARRDFTQPMWDGNPLRGGRVLIHAEQGFGDSIQFIRYARLIAERGGEVIVEGPGSLLELFRGAPGIHAVVAAGDPLPPFDRHVPMPSQAFLCRTTLASIPREVPYLFAPETRRCLWRHRLERHAAKLRVGLTWASNPENSASRIRDIPLTMLAPLLQVNGVDFFSLQIGPGAEQIQGWSSAAFIQDHTVDIHDFADTAALMAELDLIISVDTAAPHLAGALGRPVWTLLPFVPDWRWGLECDGTPWYPTMRLFRQPARGDWAPVIQRVADELRVAVGTGPFGFQGSPSEGSPLSF